MKRNKIYSTLLIGLMLSLSPISLVGADKNIVSQDELIKLYIATFDRIPDVEGLDYWENSSGFAIETIAQSFFDQKETQLKYPESLSTADFVKSVYNNVFGRDPDDKGLEYWVKELDSSNISKDAFILAVTNGALDNDEKILSSKTEFALKFILDNKKISKDEYREKASTDFENFSRNITRETPVESNRDVLSELDNIIDDIKDDIDEVKDKYHEYTSTIDDRGERPFTPVFQANPYDRTTLISANCSSNQEVKFISYTTAMEAYSRYFVDIQNLISNPQQGVLKPFIDVRYFNPMSKYIDGGDYSFYPNHSEFTALDVRTGIDNMALGTDASRGDTSGGIVQSECVNGELAIGSTINLYDTPEQSIVYGGPQTTFIYQLASSSLTSPWSSNQKGNLAMEAYFNEPIYANYSTNTGGGVSYVLFLNNKKTGVKMNYVIAIYLIGDAWIAEKAGIKFDPTTNMAHIATIIDDSSWWSTKSQISPPAREIKSNIQKKTVDDGQWNDFYRVNISYQNLLAVLNELKTNPPVGAENTDFGVSPEDWEVTSIMVQYELEESGGKALLSGSFRGFNAYITEDAI